MQRRTLTIVTMLAAVSFQLPLSGQESEGTVGQWGDPARIQIEGARQLDPRQIKKGLVGNFRHFMASHPSASLAALPKSIQKHLQNGYQRAGFGEASVAVRLDFETQQILVQVDEGVRRRAGEIRVEGPPKIQDRLAKLLAERRTPDGATPSELSDYGGVIAWADADGKNVEEEKPLWIHGLPAQLDAPAAEARRKRVQQHSADLGFDRAQFESTVITEGPLATWQVHVSELGPPAILRAIETTGNLKNTHEEIVAYLNVRPGTIVTRELRQKIERSLWNSARFTASKVEAERLPDATGVLLKIDVQEYAHAPRLSEPLSREEQAMMKHRHWMIHGAGSQMDIVVTAAHADSYAEVIMSPVEGMSCCWWKSAEAEGLPEFAIMATDQDLAAYALKSRRVLSGPVTGSQLNAKLSMVMNNDDPDHPFKLKFGFGIKTIDDGESRTPLTLVTSMPPVFFLAQAHELVEHSWAGRILSIRSERGTLRIQEKTGELIDLTSVAADDGTKFGYSFERNAFAKRRQEIVDATAGATNDFDSARPVSSVSAFFLHTGMLSTVGEFWFGEEVAEQTPQSSLAVLGKLIDHGLLAIADTVVTEVLEEDVEVFKIPSQAEPQQPFQITHFYGFLVAQAADRVLPRDTWAWTMWREASLVVAGLGQHAGSELTKMMADERCGPSSYWLLAELLNTIKKPVGPIAQRGLGKFNRQAFTREWETALGGDLHPSVAATLTSLRSLSDDDVAKLMELVGDPQPAWIRIAGQLRAATEPRSNHTMADLLGGIWSTELRDRLQQRLRQLATPIRVSERPPKVER